MAALWSARSSEPAYELVDLRRLGPGALDELLQEEVEAWRRSLHWDFTPSAQLVQRYVSIHALDGLALLSKNGIAGYLYWVSEDAKALLGDLYVRDAERSHETENLLLEGALQRLIGGPHLTSNWIRRIEGQLMQAELSAEEAAPHGPRPKGFRRHFMLAKSAVAGRMEPHRLPSGFLVQQFGPRWIDGAAQLIARTYAGHVDSEINDQYRTSQGASRFLHNVVQYPGCGVFQPQASSVLLDPEGRVRGLSVASRVAQDVGHLAQICVDPGLQGHGCGYELLRRTMVSLVGEGVAEISLTVTETNDYARALYLRNGFRVVREFDALIWDGLAG